MTSDETVVRSFVGEEEALSGTWTVTKISESLGQIPPMTPGEEVVGVTDERVLWFEDELAEIPIDEVEELDCEFVERQSAPPMVLGAGLLVVLGVFASIGAFLANAGGTLVVAMPTLSAIAIFLLAFVVARVTGQEGETRSAHRLRLWTTEETVSIWGETEAVEAIEAAVCEAPAFAGSVVESDADDQESATDAAMGERDDRADGEGGDPTAEPTDDDSKAVE